MPDPTTMERTDRTDITRQSGAQDESKPAPAPTPTTRGRMGAVTGVRILGSGAFVPDNRITNEDLAALGCDSEWIVRRTGILERRHATDDQATSDLCYEAAKRCLDDAGVSAD